MIGLQTNTTDMLFDQCACAPEVEARDWLTDQNDRRADTFLISAYDGTSFKKPGGRERCLNSVNLIKNTVEMKELKWSLHQRVDMYRNEILVELKMFSTGYLSTKVRKLEKKIKDQREYESDS